MSDLFNAVLKRHEKEFGTEPHKLVRKYDPATSIEAASKVDSTRLEKLVLETIESFGVRGCISDEVQANLSYLPYSSVTSKHYPTVVTYFSMAKNARGAPPENSAL